MNFERGNVMAFKRICKHVTIPRITVVERPRAFGRDIAQCEVSLKRGRDIICITSGFEGETCLEKRAG